ncbi:RidA family protein [Bryobacter aggregatus]|uniref:RidA family protein n=1 Tax=Bryobacter aggregatus TaxID=360054 RepID=UPI0006908F27|nr:RidA family protein [Bryobacter aggregatus]
MRLALLAVLSFSISAQEIKPLFPATGPKPVGPYSPGIAVGEFVFVSGQGVLDSAGKRPADTRSQAIQCINNVRNILKLGHLDLANIFSLQIYLTDKSQEAIVDQVLKDSFSGKVPPHSLLYVPKLPVETPLEITAYAHKNKQSGELEAPSLEQAAGCKASKQFVQCGVEVAAGGADVEQQTAAVLGALDARLKLHGSSLAKVVATNVYLTDISEFSKMNAAYASFFLLRAPTRTTVQPFSISRGRVAISVVASK